MIQGLDMATIKLRYIWTDKDRHGNTRRYLKQPGKPKIRLKSEPGTPAFVAEYQLAAEGEIAPTPSNRIVPGSVLDACRGYYASSLFKTLAANTQNTRRRILDKACTKIGQLPIAGIAQRNVMQWFDAKAHQPEAANNFLKSFRGLFKYAMRAELVTADPTEKIKKIVVKTDGFHTWTLDEVRTFEAKHAIGTTPRLVLALLLYTGQRGSDVIRMGLQHVADGIIRVQQGKTKKVLYLPIQPALAEVIAASKTGQLAFIVTSHGRPYTVKGFGNAFRGWCDQAGLPKRCSAHGLRKAGATIAAELGASQHMLMALYGWTNPDQAMVYTRKADQLRLAREGARLVEIGTKAQPEYTHLDGGGSFSANNPMKSRRL